MSLRRSAVDDNFDDGHEWWLSCELPPLHIDLTEEPPDVDNDPGADVDRVWSESELPPLIDWDDDDQPPGHLLDDRRLTELITAGLPAAGVTCTALTPAEPAPGQLPQSRLVVGGRVLTRAALRAAGDTAAPTPLEGSWVGGLSSAELVGALRELQGLRSWVDGLAVQALARVADLDTSGVMWCQEEVAAALRLAPVTVGRRIADAQVLCHELPLTVESLLAGRVTAGHGMAVVETARALPPGLAGPLEEAVLGGAATQTPGQLRRSLRRAAIGLDPGQAEQRREAGRAERRVRVFPGEDGMSGLVADLTAEDAAAVYALLDAAADQQLIADCAAARAGLDARPAGGAEGVSGDAGCAAGGGGVAGCDAVCTAGGGLALRTKDQVRADLLVDVILAGLDPDRLPTRQGRRPVISVHVGLDTLTRVNDEHGWLDGYGPITAQTARELAADETGTWRRLVTDPATRRLLAYDITRYVPPRAVVEHIVTAMPTCTFPGCGRASQRCELDHAQAHSRGGLTRPEDLHPLCKRHHICKHDSGWDVTLKPDGVTNWTSPHRRAYQTRPVNRLGPEDYGAKDDGAKDDGAKDDGAKSDPPKQTKRSPGSELERDPAGEGYEPEPPSDPAPF